MERRRKSGSIKCTKITRMCLLQAIFNNILPVSPGTTTLFACAIVPNASAVWQKKKNEYLYAYSLSRLLSSTFTNRFSCIRTPRRNIRIYIVRNCSGITGHKQCAKNEAESIYHLGIPHSNTFRWMKGTTMVHQPAPVPFFAVYHNNKLTSCNIVYTIYSHTHLSLQGLHIKNRDKHNLHVHVVVKNCSDSRCGRANFGWMLELMEECQENFFCSGIL